MAQVQRASGKVAGGDPGPSLSERLLAVLTREMAALEGVVKELKPMNGKEEAGLEAEVTSPLALGGAKGRIEAVGQMTRTLEKLLELRRLEALEARGDGDEDGETVRLREEMLRRLKALDAKRRAGPTLFSADGSLAGMKAVGETVGETVGAERVSAEPA